MIRPKTRWKLDSVDESTVAHLVEELKCSPLLATLYVQRGLTTKEQVQTFLQTTGEGHDPYLLKNMDIAIERIHQAIDDGERILVYGDYDADGVTSTTVMVTALRDKGAIVDFYIPNRFTEGYGPNTAAFQQAKEAGVTLIITVDNGISGLEPIQYAQDQGIDVIVTDHHEIGPELPPAYAIIHPRLVDQEYPFGELAGVGIAFKVAHALYGHFPKHLVELAAIGTIADLVPLQDENRLFAAQGIQALKRSNRLGIKALLKKASAKQEELDEETIGFVIGPRLNAIGRLGDAKPAVDLLLAEEVEEAMELAEEIDQANKERKDIVKSITEEAMEQVEDRLAQGYDDKVHVIGKEGWNAGVVGIVASRLVDKYYRPTIVLGFDEAENKAKGSARSIEGFDLFESLSECRDILPHFGGHAMAAGMTLQLSDVESLRQRLNEIASQSLTQEQFIPLTKIQVALSPSEVDINSLEEIQQLAPFGMGNPKPKVMIKESNLSSVRKIGNDQSHLKLVLESEEVELDVVGFGFGSMADQLSPLAKISAIGELSINEWNNRKKAQLMLQDIQVNHLQVYDYRGVKQWKRWIDTVPNDDSMYVLFREQSKGLLPLNELPKEPISYQEVLKEKASSVVFLDLPPSLEELSNAINCLEPERVYAVFHHQEDNFFSTFPTRDHFKWFYGFLLKRGSFDLKKHGEALANHRGWSKETVKFMSQVFFELEFVTIDDGILSPNTNVQKKDLHHSPSYAKRQAAYEVENMLLYSSLLELTKLLQPKEPSLV
ncbi:single-stranded-DNA-specific exonuclease RecJ [Mangrovibacillus cuniculi]|uniref:Single-stranded-DNA-specific exonuclease RecJ n=1 Tax=Mangrovibacillus cuniculi TaxID=2593652 RepID=A0A7S8HG20_9BACI|nr:single-stranded-DNA-specific exonuclease RecJ [Mangrovibacillus cuniculi]QPC47015.1 single-stranded-DNA-specific exonuclease RecJ [Mangrovibacillus cuniculi]